MGIHEHTPTQISIEFPLGLSLLVALLFFICCFFCCCLHWDKIQSFFPSNSSIINNHNINPPHFNFTSSHHKPGFPVLMMQQNHVQSLPVLMPGDEVPKFIARECPCKPPNPMDENITIHVQKTPPSGFCSAI